VLVGHWDKAILKSISWGITLLICYYFWETGIEGFSFSEVIRLTPLFFSAYLILSFVFWLLFGLPLHLVLCKYSKNSYINYILAPLVFCLYLILTSQFEAAFLIGLPAVFQVVVFRCYVFKT
jgi:hypothetical protein